jgi:hypothetical protein
MSAQTIGTSKHLRAALRVAEFQSEQATYHEVECPAGQAPAQRLPASYRCAFDPARTDRSGYVLARAALEQEFNLTRSGRAVGVGESDEGLVAEREPRANGAAFADRRGDLERVERFVTLLQSA